MIDKEKEKILIQTYKHYDSVKANLKSNKSKTRFASYVIYDSTFGASEIVDVLLKKTNKFDVKFVIIPDVLRGNENLLSTYIKTKETFSKRYGADKIVDGYDIEKNEFLDPSDDFDVVYMANPYDCMVNYVHSISYLSTKNLLPIHISYGFPMSEWYFTNAVTQMESSLFYKFYIDTFITGKEIQRYQIGCGKNLVISGYSKMDNLKKMKMKKNDKKKILIAPHHTVVPGDFQISNFLTYSELILKLPELYPQVDFIFRPHPLLFINLVNNKIWTQQQVEDYINKLNKNNIVYSTEADYLHLYSECDAIIHDCGSFMAEWLYTGKPCCFVVDDENRVRKQISDLANICLNYHTIAVNEKMILDFIDMIISNQYKIKIPFYVRKNIMVNFPNVSKKIIKNLFDF